MNYVIAAYGIVVGSLIAYGLWVQRQRRSVQLEQEEQARHSGSGS